MASLFTQAMAQTFDAAKFGGVVDPIITHIVNPVIEILFATGILVFAFGVVEMIIHGGDAAAREKGRYHMLFGALGMFIMVSAWGIIYLIANTVRGI